MLITKTITDDSTLFSRPHILEHLSLNPKALISKTICSKHIIFSQNEYKKDCEIPCIVIFFINIFSSVSIEPGILDTVSTPMCTGRATSEFLKDVLTCLKSSLNPILSIQVSSSSEQTVAPAYLVKHTYL